MIWSKQETEGSVTFWLYCGHSRGQRGWVYLLERCEGRFEETERGGESILVGGCVGRELTTTGSR